MPVPAKLAVAGRWLAVTGLLNLAWEAAQLPLYTIWTQAPRRVAFLAALHCTAGDVVIAAASLAASLLLFGRAWPAANYGRVAIATVAVTVAYTIFSEWLNTSIRLAWSYSPLMPTVPWLGTGLAPLLQWFVIPVLGFLLMRPHGRH